MGEFPHKFTAEERVKGGKARTGRKRSACRINPLKHGKYAQSRELKRCSGCEFSRVCTYYEKNGFCKPQVEAVRGLMRMHLSQNPIHVFEEVDKALQELRILISTQKHKEKALFRYIRLLFEYEKCRFGGNGGKLEIKETVSPAVQVVDAIFEKYEKMKKNG